MFYLTYVQPKLQLNMIYNGEQGTNITKLNGKVGRSSMHLSCCFRCWFILYLKMKACTTLVLTCFLFSFGDWFLSSPSPRIENMKNVLPKGHFMFWALFPTSFVNFSSWCLIIKLHPIGFPFFTFAKFCKVCYWLNLAHEGSIVFLFQVFLLFILKDSKMF